MKLKIDKKVEAPFTNTFTVDIKTMEGDADDSHNLEFAITEEDLPKLKEFLDSCAELCRRGMGGGEAQEWVYKVKHFDYFVGDCEWPCKEGYYDSYRSHTFYWYDENGQKYHAKLTK